jgi:heme/copper-type cytochrome/quinol oxidase subunit 3
VARKVFDELSFLLRAGGSEYLSNASFFGALLQAYFGLRHITNVLSLKKCTLGLVFFDTLLLVTALPTAAEPGVLEKN